VVYKKSGTVLVRPARIKKFKIRLLRSWCRSNCDKTFGIECCKTCGKSYCRLIFVLIFDNRKKHITAVYDMFKSAYTLHVDNNKNKNDDYYITLHRLDISVLLNNIT